MEMHFDCADKVTDAEVEKTCGALGLECTMRGALKSLPDNVHWHFKKGKLPGVLEITLLLKEHKLILNCKKNRQGEWVGDVVEGLRRRLGLRACDS
jgi:hypothetical protein